MKIGIIPNTNKEYIEQIIREICSILKEVDVIIDDNAKSEIQNKNFIFGDITRTDIALSIGGDGTLLKAAKMCAPFNIPVIGINFGHLGFLTEIKADEIKVSLEKIIQERYYIEERMMLDIKVLKNNEIIFAGSALNDVVLSRKLVSRIVNTTVRVNNQFVDLYRADGVIVSTPTGSTAYSLSAGGPIIDPLMKLMVITPVCPHCLHSRSIVVSQDKVITLKAEENQKNEVLLTIDGQISIDIESDMIIEIKSSKSTAKLIKFDFYNFYDNIHNRLFKRENNSAE